MSRSGHELSWLNGWRRLGIVLIGIWIVMASYVLRNAPDRILHHFPELGVQKIGAFRVPAPELKEKLEADKVRKLGRELMPWEEEWNPVRLVAVPIGTELPQTTRFILLLAIPAATWLLAEALAWIARWVRAGFVRAPSTKT